MSLYVHSSVFVCVVALHISANPETAEKYSQSICNTPECLKSAKQILYNMDSTVDPCQDFYRFACGGFMKKTTIPPDRSMWTVTSDIELKMLRRVQQEFNSTSLPKNKPRYFHQAWKFYKTCMDIETIEDVDLRHIKAELEQLGGWPVMDDHGIWDEDEFHWTNMTVALAARGWSWDMLVDVVVALDAKNTSSYRLELTQCDLGIAREYLIKGLEDEIVLAYYEMMVEVAVQFGVPFHYAKEDMSDVLMLEIELAKISVPQEEMRDHFRLNNLMTLAEMDINFPYANWSQLVSSCLERYVAVTSGEVVNVAVPSYFHQLGDLLNRVDKRIIANYMLWQVVYESMPFLTTRVAYLSRQLMLAMTGIARFRPRWEFCVNNLVDRFEHVVGAAYVRNYVNPDLKHEAYKMVKVIDDEFRKYISKVSWMDKKTSSKAKKKAENIFYHIGYPDELFDDKVLEEYYKEVNVTGDLLFTVLNLQEWESRRAFTLLRSKVNKTRWEIHSDVTDVNAFYIDDQNAVEIPAGILQDVFYSSNRPDSLNMGAIGAVIAHELTHSIDDEGKQYDYKGNLKQWWDHETDRHFKHRAQAIVSAYSKYTVKAVNMTLNGVNVQGEMIADHGGLKLAYNAYRSSRVGNYSGPRLANLEDFTSDQLFWLSYANSWCAKERLESVRSGIISDVHPPAEVRVNGPFRNSEIFAHDWGCPPHSFMNPRKKHNVW